MKFSTLVIGLYIRAPAAAFAPSATNTHRSSSVSLNQSLRSLAITSDSRKSKIPALIQENKASTATMTAPPAAATSSSVKPTEKEVRALFELWNQALATGDSRIVADRYIKSPMLLPTVSDKPRTNFGEVKDYFDAFLLK